MDIATIIGLIACIACVILGIVTGSSGVAGLINFYDLVSIFITFGGTFSCLVLMHRLPDFVSGLKSFKVVLKKVEVKEEETIGNILRLTNIARKEGLLSLEEAANDLEDEFMKKGILLIVDGTDPELVRSILETELVCTENRHKKSIRFWEKMAEFAPAWGMIGTLVGLVNMLKTMSDVSTVGPNMAVAILTTLYGSLLANWIASPVAIKLKENSEVEITLKEVMIEGLLSIQAGENPRVIEEKLKSFLSPAQRKFLEAKNDDGGE